MKKIIVGAAFASLLVATAAVAQAPRRPSLAEAATAAGVPATFALRDAGVDIEATVPSPRSIRLGDVTVLQLQDRDVKLRFATLGAPPLPVPANAPRGQALVTVGIDVVVLRRH